MARTVGFQTKVLGPNGQALNNAVDKAVSEGLDNLVNELETRWLRHAEMKLNTSIQDYMEGVSVAKTKDGAEITIKGWLPVALETGAPGFDMKPGLLAGRDFRVIPMHDGEFRTVSKNSPPESWKHPGLEARNIHEAVEAEADDIIQKSFGSAFERIRI